MNTPRLAFRALSGLLCVGPLCLALGAQEQPETVEYHQVIAPARLKALQQASEFGRGSGQPTSGQPKSGSTAHQSFQDQSDFIVFNRSATFAPKGALIHVPENLRPAVTTPPRGTRLMLWKDFLRVNPAVVSAFEVSLTEAAGSEPIAAERLDAARRTGKILVAVHGGNPISLKAALPAVEGANPDDSP